MNKYYLPPELWNKIIVMSNYLMTREKKMYFTNVHTQLKLLFDDAYAYHIDKYIGYESFIIFSGVDEDYEFDEEKIKGTEQQILYVLCKSMNLVSCIKGMMRNRQEYI